MSMNILNQGAKLLDPAASTPKSTEAVNKPALTPVGGAAAGKPVAEAPPTASGGAVRSDDPQEINKAISKLNDSVQNIQRSIEFSLDEESGRNVVKVVDRDSGEVIRQIPSDEVLALSRNLKAFLESREAVGDSGNAAQQVDALGFFMREEA